MSVTNPWIRHFQIGWENRAADAPLWARIVSLAYGRNEANGHANFRRGDLSWILGTPAKDGQPFKRRHSASIREVAVKHGWLAKGSCNECLIVPSHKIEGPLGNPNKPCPVHERKNAEKRSEVTRLTLVS